MANPVVIQIALDEYAKTIGEIEDPKRRSQLQNIRLRRWVVAFCGIQQFVSVTVIFGIYILCGAGVLVLSDTALASLAAVAIVQPAVVRIVIKDLFPDGANNHWTAALRRKHLVPTKGRT